MLRILMITDNEQRHQYVCDTISRMSNIELEVIHEYKSTLLHSEHFNLRTEMEKKYLPIDGKNYKKELIPKGKLDRSSLLRDCLARKYNFVVTYGCSIIPLNLIKQIPVPLINVHLGLSPYYRGSGTNFWPIFNHQMALCGVTYHKLTDVIDGGDILYQRRVDLEIFENSHHLGCSLIKCIPYDVYQILTTYYNVTCIKQTDNLFCNSPRLYYRRCDFDYDKAEIVANDFIKINLKMTEGYRDYVQMWKIKDFL